MREKRVYREKDGLIYVKISNNLVCVCVRMCERKKQRIQIKT